MRKRLTKTIWYGSDVDSNGNPILPSTHGGLDGLNYGELYLHLSNGKASLWTLYSDGKIVEITGGGSEVDMSSYLLKSIWDKVFEIRTDSQGIEYIFGKLPMVTQYGITMYSGDGVDIPSLASGLPFDGRTIWYNPDTQQIEVIGGTGGGSGEGVSNFWDLSGIPSWITNSKPKYTYSEIEGTPDLSGYATQSWVENKKYLTSITSAMVTSALGFTPFNSASFTKANIKSALGISDWALASSKPSYTTSEVTEGTNLYFTNARAVSALTETLKSYVTLGGTQTITGEKNFTGGLKVNGSPIYYNTEKKYWKLEGDLLVTGGVTMYGSDSSFTPSTIMDALLYDDATLGINSNGQLYVKGGAGGEGLDITALQNYLTQNSYLNVTSGDNRYLKLSGGSMNGVITMPINYQIQWGSSSLMIYGEDTNAIKIVAPLGLYVNSKEVWHSGNFNPSDYLPLSGGTLRGGASISWGDANNGLTDTSDWNIKTDGLRILSSITSGSNAPSQYAAGLHVVGRYGFQIACEATSSNFYMRNIRDGINDWCKLWHAGNFTPSNYLPLSGGTMTGNILLGGTTTNKIGTNIVDTSGGYQEFTHQNSHGYIAIGPFNDSVAHIYTDRPSFYFNKDLYVNNAKVWNASNDGSGSTLDADLLDGKHDGYVIAESLRNRTNDNSSIVLYSATRTDNTWPRSIVDNGYGLMIASNNTTGYIATVNSNVASATKLQTARTIWGQSFDGTGNVSGILTLPLSHQVQWADSGGAMIYAVSSKRIIIDGSVGIGTPNPQDKLDVAGNIITSGGLLFTRLGTGTYNKFTISSNTTYGIEIEAPRATDSATGTALPIFIGWRGGALGIKITSGGNLLANGGITMYSDQRKKTILNHVELSLKQIAEAPLIEHYYNGDDKRTTHVGSIAQYWASMNDWFCKLDSEGYYTMEIQNAALASAISIARELDRYETKTDKDIKKLKKRICELEEEVERLKSA